MVLMLLLLLGAVLTGCSAKTHITPASVTVDGSAESLQPPVGRLVFDAAQLKHVNVSVQERYWMYWTVSPSSGIDNRLPVGCAAEWQLQAHKGANKTGPVTVVSTAPVAAGGELSAVAQWVDPCQASATAGRKNKGPFDASVALQFQGGNGTHSHCDGFASERVGAELRVVSSAVHANTPWFSNTTVQGTGLSVAWWSLLKSSIKGFTSNSYYNVRVRFEWNAGEAYPFPGGATLFVVSTTEIGSANTCSVGNRTDTVSVLNVTVPAQDMLPAGVAAGNVTQLSVTVNHVAMVAGQWTDMWLQLDGDDATFDRPFRFQVTGLTGDGEIKEVSKKMATIVGLTIGVVAGLTIVVLAVIFVRDKAKSPKSKGYEVL